MRLLTLFLCIQMGFALAGADTAVPAAKPPVAQQAINPDSPLSPAGAGTTPTDLTLLSSRYTNAIDLAAGPDDVNIAKWTTRILMRSHYRQMPIDDRVASKFLDRYLDMLDPLHLLFLQTDVDEFEPYRTTLDDLILKGDTKPSLVIFKRFVERYEQQAVYVNGLLKTEQFVFDGNDRFLLNRKNAARPTDLVAAKELWRQRLRYEYLQEKLNKEKPEEIIKLVSRRYSRIWRALREWDSDDVFSFYLTSLAHVYDPHSDYMSKSQLDSFSIGMKLSLFGIGALLQSEDGYCKIKELVPGGPAVQSKKLKPNDRIIAVAQGANEPVDVVEMKLTKVVEMIRGAKDTEVRLTIIPADAPDPSTRKTVSLIRDEIKLEDQEAKAKLIELPYENGRNLRLGVIDLSSFYADMDSGKPEHKSTTTDVAKLLKKLKQENVNGVILDLRRNGGGSLEEAINLSGLFIKEGPIVQVKDPGPNGKIEVDRDTDPSVAYDGPLIVLTSRHSASASEILAGALQDYDRALIVGDSSTHGKGTVQSLVKLGPIMRMPNAGALKITIRKFYRASGSSTQLKGVIPNIVLPSLNNHAEIGESSLENPLPWDTIDSVRYDKVNRIQPFLAELQKRSVARVQADQDFTYLQEEIERYKKMIADKTVSMNEEQRRQEKKETEARAKVRKKELLSRPESREKSYELTLKLADLPGLPPPVAKTNDVATAESKTALSADEDSEDHAEDKLPALDITLEETKRILVDLINLSSKGTPITFLN